MYSLLPSFILGFHGCDQSVAEKVLNGEEHLQPSTQSYDWLGHGVYFWENDPHRALSWAEEKKERANVCSSEIINNPAVVGAIIDPGYCFNLFSSAALEVLRTTHKSFVKTCREADVELPQNKALKTSEDLLLRHLDCAVIEYMHAARKEAELASYDSVRGVFFEGDDLYQNAGFKEKNHVQVCVRSPQRIKGYFRPLNFSS